MASYQQLYISKILKKKSTSEAIPSPEELVGMFFKWTELPDSQIGFAVLPYINSVTEPLTIILNNNGIRATTRPVKTLQQEFASPHAWLEGPTIDFENARVIDRGNSCVRKTLESWHTAITS